MKFEIDKETLRKACEIAHPLCKSNSMDILNNFYLESCENELVLKGCNLTTNATIRMKADVTTNGKCLVNAEKLFQMITAYKDYLLVVEISSGKLSVTNGKSTTKLITSNAGDYPEFSIEKEPLCSFFIDSEKLTNSVKAVEKALPKKDPRQVLNGIYLYTKGNESFFVTTDGKRIHRSKCSITSNSKNDGANICSQFILRAARNLDDDCLVTFTDRQTQISGKSESLVIDFCENSILGKYPILDAVIPKSYDVTHELILPRAPMLSALRSALVTSDNLSNRVSLEFSDSELCISSSSQDGLFSESMSCSYKGDVFKVTINGNYLVDILGTFSQEKEVKVSINSNRAPIRITGDTHNECYLMPMKVNEDLRGNNENSV